MRTVTAGWLRRTRRTTADLQDDHVAADTFQRLPGTDARTRGVGVAGESQAAIPSISSPNAVEEEGGSTGCNRAPHAVTWSSGMLALFALGFSLPLDHWRAQPISSHPPSRPQRSAPLLPRRAPLAEHAWEEHVLRNLTRSA